ncbi:MAG: hypothetical protein ACI4RT_03775 [Candidatus Spyradenecus sp.]
MSKRKAGGKPKEREVERLIRAIATCTLHPGERLDAHTKAVRAKIMHDARAFGMTETEYARRMWVRLKGFHAREATNRMSDKGYVTSPLADGGADYDRTKDRLAVYIKRARHYGKDRAWVERNIKQAEKEHEQRN